MPLTFNECIKIAVTRFTLTDQNRFPTWQEMEEQFGHDPSVLKDAVKTAFRKGLVRIVGLPQPPMPCLRNRDLEDRLKRIYQRLRSVIVMDTSQIRFSGPQLDDEIHHVLGHEAAKIIADGWLFRSGDVIGVGAGRGVYYTVDALSFMPETLFCDRIKIVSLTGSVETKDHMSLVAEHMDADLHALNLMRCFTGATAKFISAKITPANTHQTALAPNQWDGFRPNQALVGVGVLAEGHRFFEEVAGPKPRSILAPLREDLKTLVECCQNIETHVAVENYCAVGDLCHQLFFINPPPSGKTIGKGLRDNVDKLIGQINAQTLTVNEAQIASIDNITVIAGTARKAFALMELLNLSKYNIHYLCTDSGAAQTILNNQRTPSS